MGYTTSEIASFIASEMRVAIGRPDVTIVSAEYQDWRYVITLKLPEKQYYRISLNEHLAKSPLTISDFIDGFLPDDVEEQIQQSWRDFHQSIDPFVQEIKYRVNHWFDLRDLKEIALALTEDERTALRQLQDTGVFEPEWLGGPMNRTTWDALTKRDTHIAALNHLCSLGLARMMDDIGYVVVTFDGRGADALYMLDQETP